MYAVENRTVSATSGATRKTANFRDFKEAIGYAIGVIVAAAAQNNNHSVDSVYVDVVGDRFILSIDSDFLFKIAKNADVEHYSSNFSYVDEFRGERKAFNVHTDRLAEAYYILGSCYKHENPRERVGYFIEATGLFLCALSTARNSFTYDYRMTNSKGNAVTCFHADLTLKGELARKSKLTFLEREELYREDEPKYIFDYHEIVPRDQMEDYVRFC